MRLPQHGHGGCFGRLLRLLWFALADGGRRDGGYFCKQSTDQGEFPAAMAVGEEAVMPDALEAVGQHMEQKAANEPIRCERHGLDLGCIAIISPREGDAAVGKSQQAAI